VPSTIAAMMRGDRKARGASRRMCRSPWASRSAIPAKEAMRPSGCRRPVDQRIHLRPRLSNPTRMPAIIAISIATRGMCSIVVSRSVLAPATRSCALLAGSEIFCRIEDSVCRRGGLRANKFGHRRSQFRDVVAQCRKIGGEILGSLFYRFNARHIPSPVLSGKVIRGCARGDPSDRRNRQVCLHHGMI